MLHNFFFSTPIKKFHFKNNEFFYLLSLLSRLVVGKKIWYQYNALLTTTNCKNNFYTCLLLKAGNKKVSFWYCPEYLTYLWYIVKETLFIFRIGRQIQSRNYWMADTSGRQYKESFLFKLIIIYLYYSYIFNYTYLVSIYIIRPQLSH